MSQLEDALQDARTVLRNTLTTLQLVAGKRDHDKIAHSRGRPCRTCVAQENLPHVQGVLFDLDVLLPDRQPAEPGNVMLMWTEGEPNGRDERVQYVTVQDTPEGRAFLFSQVSPGDVLCGDVNYDTMILHRCLPDSALPPALRVLKEGGSLVDYLRVAYHCPPEVVEAERVHGAFIGKDASGRVMWALGGSRMGAFGR